MRTAEEWIAVAGARRLDANDVRLIQADALIGARDLDAALALVGEAEADIQRKLAALRDNEGN